MYEIYTLYLIEEENKVAEYGVAQNHTKDMLIEIGEESVKKGEYDRYVIIGLLKGNKHELNGYKILDFWEKRDYLG